MGAPPSFVSQGQVTCLPLRTSLHFPSARAFLRAARVGAESCELFWEAEALPPVGVEVHLEVRVGPGSTPMLIRGRVHHPHGRAEGMERPGAWVRIDGPAMFPFAAAWAQAVGHPLSWGRRSAVRWPVEQGAEVAWEGGPCEAARLLDLSRGGARLEVGSRLGSSSPRLRLKVRTGLLRWESVAARLAWSRPQGAGREVGLEFLEMPASVQAWLRATLDQAQARRGGR